MNAGALIRQLHSGGGVISALYAERDPADALADFTTERQIANLRLAHAQALGAPFSSDYAGA